MADSFDDNHDRKRRRRIAEAPYDVGYGKPPVHTQFGKDNPVRSPGRPRGSKNKKPPAAPINFLQAALEHGRKEVQVNENGRSKPVARYDACLSMIFINSKTSVKAAELYTKIVHHAFESNEKDKDRLVVAIRNWKDDASSHIEFCRKERRLDPNILPHPDHVHFDVATSGLRISGPSDPEEKKVWDDMAAWLEKATAQRERAIAELPLEQEDWLIQAWKLMIRNRTKEIRLLKWWFETYDGGPRCRDGHRPEELNAAMQMYLPEGWIDWVRCKYEGSYDIEDVS